MRFILDLTWLWICESLFFQFLKMSFLCFEGLSFCLPIFPFSFFFFFFYLFSVSPLFSSSFIKVNFFYKIRYSSFLARNIEKGFSKGLKFITIRIIPKLSLIHFKDFYWFQMFTNSNWTLPGKVLWFDWIYFFRRIKIILK